MKFAETPYFLLNNFLNYKYSVVIPPDPVNEVRLLWDGSLFYNRQVDFIIGNVVPAFGWDEFNTLLVQSDTYDDDSTFTDSSDNDQALVLSGNPIHKLVNSAYGASSIYFNGNSNITTETYTYNLSGDWTFDIALRPTTYIDKFNIFSLWNSDDNGFGLYGNTDGSLSLENTGDDSIICQSPSGTFDTTQTTASDYWKHIVVQKENDIVEIKFHGSQVVSAAWVDIDHNFMENHNFTSWTDDQPDDWTKDTPTNDHFLTRDFEEYLPLEDDYITCGNLDMSSWTSGVNDDDLDEWNEGSSGSSGNEYRVVVSTIPGHTGYVSQFKGASFYPSITFDLSPYIDVNEYAHYAITFWVETPDDGILVSMAYNSGSYLLDGLPDGTVTSQLRKHYSTSGSGWTQYTLYGVYDPSVSNTGFTFRASKTLQVGTWIRFGDVRLQKCTPNYTSKLKITNSTEGPWGISQPIEIGKEYNYKIDLDSLEKINILAGGNSDMDSYLNNWYSQYIDMAVNRDTYPGKLHLTGSNNPTWGRLRYSTYTDKIGIGQVYDVSIKSKLVAGTTPVNPVGFGTGVHDGEGFTDTITFYPSGTETTHTGQITASTDTIYVGNSVGGSIQSGSYTFDDATMISADEPEIVIYDGSTILNTITTTGIISGTFTATSTSFSVGVSGGTSEAFLNSVTVSDKNIYDNLSVGYSPHVGQGTASHYEGFAEEIRFSDTQVRFSEPYSVPTSAYHDTFSTVVVSGSPAVEYTNYPNTPSISAAGDIGGIVFFDYNGAEWNFEYNTLEASSYGGYLCGMNKGIFTKGDGVLTLYIENSIENDALTDKQKGFVPVAFETINIDDNEINVDVKNISTLTGEITGQVVGSNPSGGYFDAYSSDTSETVNVSDGKKIYFRKDGFFHQWLEEYAVAYFRDEFGYDIDIRSYVNTDKIFVYLGRIYPAAAGQEYNYKIIYEGLKDYVITIPPKHQRTPNLKEMVNIFFDQLYHKVYTKQKDILSMNDPMEVDINYLGYLSRYYGMQDLENITLEPERYREFVRDIIHFLKRKGSFADLYVIWKVIGQTGNYLNVYERWVNASVATSAMAALTTIKENQWIDHLYTSKYLSASTSASNTDYQIWEPPTDGAGIGWYANLASVAISGIDICASELTDADVRAYPNGPTNPDGDTYDLTLQGGSYAMDDKILSSNYRVELDINNEPLSTEGIFPKEIADNLFYSFEFVRPAYRVARYGIVFAPIVNFTGDKVHLYSGKNERGEFYDNVYSWSQSLAFRLTEVGAFIGIQCTPATEWYFEHNLQSNKLMSQFFDLDFQELVPDTVIYSSNGLSATATFENNATGYMFLKEVNTPHHTAHITDSPSTFNWLINHTANDGTDPDMTTTPPSNNTVMVQMTTEVDGFGSDLQKITVKQVDILDKDNIHVYLDDNTEYRGDIFTFMEGNETVEVFPLSGSTSCRIQHNLFEKGLMVACYKTEANPVSGGADIQTQVIPKDMTLVSESETRVDFYEPITGVVAIMKVGNPDIYEMLIEFDGGLQVSPLYKLWGPKESDTSVAELDKYSTGEYIIDPNTPAITETRTMYASGIAGEFYNDNFYFYMDIALDYDSEMEDMRYLDIWNDKGLLLFRTETSGIYKPSEVDFKIHFRIQIPLGQ